MTREELLNLLKNNKVDEDTYDFGAGHGYYDDQFLLNRKGKKWVIYYLVRGKKIKLKNFIDEEEANDYFYNLLTNNKCS